MGVLKTVAAAVVVMGISLPVHADPILDQSVPHPGGSSGHGIIARDIAMAQTFTVGVTGVFSALDLFISRFPDDGFGPLLVDIRPTIDGMPVESDALALAVVSVPATAVTVGFGAFPLRVDFSSAGLTVATGQMLAFVLRSPETPLTGSSSSAEYALFAVDDDYTRGRPFSRAPSFGYPVFHGTDAFADFAFRTYVDPGTAPVPEPASILLLASGVAAMAGRHMRRVTRDAR
jgi:hypothetical protein